jgi:ABC-type nitrate/sulfonate/bicarbonate transport system substrate-binding protein
MVLLARRELPKALTHRCPGKGVGAPKRGQAGGPAAETREDSVSEFGDLEKKAQDYVEEHPDQADKGINEAAGFAERETDHQHDQQIDHAVDAAEQHFGQNQDQNQQGNQDDQNQQGNQN